MTALPPSGDFTNSATTEGGFKTALTNLRAYLSSILGDDGTLVTAMATLGSMFNSTSSKSTNYTVIASDRGKTIQCTATLELALTAAATLGSSFAFTVDNTGSGDVTINPSGTETIDGASTITLGAGQSCIVYCNGTSFYTVGMSVNGALINIKYFTTAGASTYSPTAGTKFIIVQVTGGGGGGGGNRGANNGAGGGGAGGTAIKKITSGFSGVTVTVGSAGSGAGAGGGSVGGTGGTSSFGALVSATGGAGGIGWEGTPFGGGGASGNGSSGDVNIRGGCGLNGCYLTGSISVSFSGQGGASFYGGGGNNRSYNDQGAGDTGKAYGSGGSGAYGNAGGGAGAAGLVIVYEYA